MNITTIIPVHKYDENIEVLLDKALNSLYKQAEITENFPVLIVHPPEIKNNLTDLIEKHEDKGNAIIEYVENNGDTDFQSQVNIGVENVKTDYFSLLEFDDEFGVTYYKQAKINTEYYPDIDLFLPMIVEVNDAGNVTKFTNETVWSRSFIGENGVLGYLSTKSLNSFTDFKFCGGIFKKSEFDIIGKLKKNIKLTFQYEYILRLINNGGKVFTIPKFIYKHLVTREDSLFMGYEKELSIDERRFWFEIAKKESNFPTDREIDTSTLKK